MKQALEYLEKIRLSTVRLKPWKPEYSGVEPIYPIFHETHITPAISPSDAANQAIDAGVLPADAFTGPIFHFWLGEDGLGNVMWKRGFTNEIIFFRPVRSA